MGCSIGLGALHNERRDRTILFWKSLPVSDLITVLSKASVPLVVMPVIAFVVIIALQLVMLAINTVVLLANGLGAPTVQTLLPQMTLVLIYGLTALALWYAPIWGWLLLISAWARRTPFLWAVLPPLALVVMEKIAFDTSHFGELLTYRLGGFEQAFTVPHQGSHMTGLPEIDAVRFLSNPWIWWTSVFARRRRLPRRRGLGPPLS